MNWISEEEFHKRYKGTDNFCWMDWIRLGIPLVDGTAIPWRTGCPYLDSFYIKTNDSSWAPPVADEWVRVKIIKEESNLDLYKVLCSGNDDCSYSFHVIGEKNIEEEIKWLKSIENLTVSVCRGRGYFFSN